MNTKTIIALVILVIVIVLGAFLIMTPGTKENNTAPFVSENVKVDLPFPGANVLQSFTATGEARGTWYFEASFGVEVRDPSGQVVGTGIAQADGEWMTPDFVRFNALVTINGYTGPATLVLKKDNPSGLPEHDDSVSFDIVVQ